MAAPEYARASGLARTLAEIALEAGAAILACRQRGVAVSRKRDASPVTEADQAAEAIILGGLSRALPGVPAIAEEAAAAGDFPETGDRFLLVDPLDGTREFVAGRSEFTVNIALIEAGRPVAGAVFAPALGLMATAEGDAALEAHIDPEDGLEAARWRRLQTRAVPQTGPVAFASRSHRDPETDAFLRARGVAAISSAGSSLKFVVVARGEADLYPRFGRTMEWDTAAGHAVLSAAGGAVVTADGAELSYGKRDRGYANPPFVAWGRRPAEARF